MSGYRPTSAIKWIIIHDTEGATAEGAAKWFANPDSRGSAHLIVDNDVCFRTLENDEIPWAAPGANAEGFHIEIAGFASWSKARWLLNLKRIRRAAYKTALHARAWHIPLVQLGPEGLKAGREGIASHNAVSKAFGGDHTDPGPNFPWSTFMWWVKYYYNRLDV